MRQQHGVQADPDERTCLQRLSAANTSPADKQEVAVWMVEPNANNRPIDWRFTTEDVRLKLHHLHPAFDV